MVTAMKNRLSLLSAFLLAVICLAPAVADDASREPVFLTSEALAGLPFSEAVRVGDLLFLAGQLGTVPGKGLVEGGIQAETRQAMLNIKRVVEKYGSSMDKVVKCTVMLADIKEWAAMNEVYKTFFDERYPARSAFGASGLALDARVEIECIAAAG